MISELQLVWGDWNMKNLLRFLVPCVTSAVRIECFRDACNLTKASCKFGKLGGKRAGALWMELGNTKCLIEKLPLPGSPGRGEMVPEKFRIPLSTWSFLL